MILALCALPLALAAGFDDVDYGMGAERAVVVDGAKLVVHEGGRPAGEARTVVLLHPFALTMMVWRDVVPLLEADFHVVAFDALGHGKSDKPLRRLRIGTLVTSLHHLLDALKLGRVILIGNSMGGGEAIAYAARHPERVEAVVLAGSVGLAFHPWYGGPWRMLGPQDMASAPELAFALAFHEAVQQRPPLVDALEAALLEGRRDPTFWRAAISQHSIVEQMVTMDRIRDVRALSMPVLVTTGAHDCVVPPWHAALLAHEIANAAHVEFDALGHLPEAEDSVLFTAVVVEFLAQLPMG